jgi:hypothetical protein
MAPYPTSLSELAQRFCTSARRVALFRGLLNYRAAMVSLGFDQGYQWIDGSFVEAVETTRGTPPNDIDLVTLTVRPSAWLTLTLPQVQAAMASRPDLFLAHEAKKAFSCEAFVIDIGQPAHAVAKQLVYWYGLFSHQRATFLWKGIVEVPLVSDDAAAAAYLATLHFPP